jgi:hypothetical protein
MMPSPSFPHGYPPSSSSLGFYNPATFPPGAGLPPAPGMPVGGPSWYGTEPTNELGGFQLSGVPAGYDLGNPFEWDPTASNIAVGKEQGALPIFLLSFLLRN